MKNLLLALETVYIDLAGNTWDKTKFTKEDAQGASDYLIKHNCKHCKDCMYCEECEFCNDCVNCTCCKLCYDCVDCTDCTGLRHQALLCNKKEMQF